MSLRVSTAGVPYSVSDKRRVDAKVILDSVYPAGGYKVRAGDFNLSELVRLDGRVAEGWLLRYDGVSRTVRVFGKDGVNQAEADVGTDLGYVDDVDVQVVGW